MLATSVAVEKNAYEVALENFDLAANALELDNNVRAMIKYPERILGVSVPVRMDDGKVVRFEGYRVQHSTMRGPAKGGIRFHPNVTVDEVKALLVAAGIARGEVHVSSDRHWRLVATKSP